MKNQLYIPKKINVGFQDRNDTYTGKLAYIIYYDEKGKLRKETSWNSWRDKKIDSQEFDNVPTTGFVLNKGVGGVRSSYGWNPRNEYIRVYDPRNFEFEVSVANLLFILRECDCSRGKGLEGEFVYSWDGTELVLLPASSQEYKLSSGFSELQGKKVAAKDFVPGYVYVNKKQEDLIYIGRMASHVTASKSYINKDRSVKPFKSHVFWNGKEFELHSGGKDIAICKSEVCVPNYAELLDKYNKSKFGSRLTSLFVKKSSGDKRYQQRWYYEEAPGVFLECYTYTTGYRESEKLIYIQISNRILISDGMLVIVPQNKRLYPTKFDADQAVREQNRYPSWYNERVEQAEISSDFIEPVDTDLFANMESGSVCQVSSYGILKEVRNGKKDN